MKKCVISFDTDHIKKYVFATDTLREIRGASALLDDLNKIEMENLVKKHVEPEGDYKRVYANGGSGMFVVPADKADDIINAVQRKYREETTTASITGVKEDLLDTWQDMPDHVPEHIQRLSYKLQMAKAATRPTATLMSHVLFKECESCHLEYAETQYPLEYAETQYPHSTDLLCRSCCIKKQKTFDDVKSKFANRPRDVNQLGSLSKPVNYIGLIYADGNNMGTFLNTLDSLEEVQIFSDTINKALINACKQATSQLPPHKDYNIVPYEILFQGGDDLVMITSAQAAIKTAITIAEEFYTQTALVRTMLNQKIAEEKLASMFQNEPTLSISIILVHAKFPFNVSISLAESALKFAKKGYAQKLRENAEKEYQGIINFMVVHSSNALDFGEFYKRDLKEENRDAREVVYRTLRPYTVEDMKRLQDYIQSTLHSVPKRKLHQLREAISQDKDHAMLSTFATLLRAKEQDKRDILEAIHRFADDKQIVYPWFQDHRNGKDRYYTPLLDAIELYEFIEQVKREDYEKQNSSAV